MKILYTFLLLLSFTSIYANELDPKPAQAIVIKVDKDTDNVTIYRVERGLFENNRFSEEEARRLVDSGLKELKEIEKVEIYPEGEAAEIEGENSVGNYYYFYNNYHPGNNYYPGYNNYPGYNYYPGNNFFPGNSYYPGVNFNNWYPFGYFRYNQFNYQFQFAYQPYGHQRQHCFFYY